MEVEQNNTLTFLDVSVHRENTKFYNMNTQEKF